MYLSLIGFPRSRSKKCITFLTSNTSQPCSVCELQDGGRSPVPCGSEVKFKGIIQGYGYIDRSYANNLIGGCDSELYIFRQDILKNGRIKGWFQLRLNASVFTRSFGICYFITCKYYQIKVKVKISLLNLG